MSLFAKIMVVVNLILAVVFLSAAGTFLNATESWKAKHTSVTKELTDTVDTLNAQIAGQKAQKEQAQTAATNAQASKAAAEGKLSVLQSSNQAVHEHNQKLEESLKTLAGTQQDLQTKNSELQTIIEDLRNEVARVEGEKRTLRDSNTTLTESLSRSQQEAKDTAAALSAAEIANGQLNSKVDSMGTTIAMYNKEFGPLPGGPQMDPLTAVVQAVDNANDIYILSVGSADNVQEGWEFTIYRDSEYIATVVIDKVFKNHASARTKSGMKRKDAQAGDGAKTIL
jgi:septal ring factor EnvC (AmiA/AmiB activator)